MAPTLRAYVAGVLPGYMIPGYFVQVADIPLTANGKTDKKKLPDPAGYALASGTNYVAPRNKTEEKISTGLAGNPG